ncbi:MAG: acyltransferase family protein [Haemophilus parainfluenzae]|nr:acyltransferase family protein [Haemophilus parainfluenzae]
MTKQRVAFLDYAKAIGIMLVVLGHVINTQGNILPSGKIVLQYIYSFHMPLFFIISGVIIENKINKYSILSIFKNLFIPYISWCFIYIILYIYINHDNWQFIFYERFIASITGRGIAPLWFIFSLLFGTLFSIFIIRLREKLKINEIVFYTCNFLLLMFLTNLSFYIEKYIGNNMELKYLYTSLSRILPSMFFILFGFFISQLFKNGDYRLCKFFLCLISLIFIITITKNGVNMHLMKLGNVLTFFTTGIIGSLTILFLSLIVKGDFLLNIGKRSFDIMVLHYPPIGIIHYVSMVLEKVGFQHSLMKYIIVAFITTIICYIISRFLLDFIRNKFFIKLKWKVL